MPKFKFKSKKSKFNFFKNDDDILNSEIVKNAYSEIYSNKKIIIDGCKNLIDYKDDYIKLQLLKGSINIVGAEFKISTFQNERIEISGNILTIEFCV